MKQTKEEMLTSLGFKKHLSYIWLHDSGLCRVIANPLTVDRYTFVTEEGLDFEIRLRLKNVSVESARKDLEKFINLTKKLSEEQ